VGTKQVGIRFNIIGIFVNDLQKTIEFYRDVIGLEVKETSESYAEFNHDGIRFAVFERAKLPEWIGLAPTYPSGLNGTFELAIDLPYFEDVDRRFDQFVKAGAKAVMKPRDMPWGQRSSLVADPDGNLIEIGSFNSGEKTL
jgi:catechol 2,3-dioxygenase-like lactoylglutathione lyase family enzyme